MTVQIEDTFLLRDVEYSLAGISSGELFDIATLGLEPSAASTACWRGYQAKYSLVSDQLVLADLAVNLTRTEGTELRPLVGPTIRGVSPKAVEGDDWDFCNQRYQGLNLPVPYSGGLLLGRGFIRELYVHMGFAPAWKFKEVLELLFVDGALTAEHDRSEQMAAFRSAWSGTRVGRPGSGVPSDEDIRAFVERAFDRSYRLS